MTARARSEVDLPGFSLQAFRAVRFFDATNSGFFDHRRVGMGRHTNPPQRFHCWTRRRSYRGVRAPPRGW